jgi:hypothetical protein
MHFKKLLLKTLSTVSVWGLSSILLELPFISSVSAMAGIEDELPTSCASHPQSHKASSLFEYDLDHIIEAQQLINDATFLPEPIRLFFINSVKTYNRAQFLSLLTQEGKESFLSNFMPAAYEMPPEEIAKFTEYQNNFLKHLIETSDMPPEAVLEFIEFQKVQLISMQTGHARAQEATKKNLEQLYTPHIENIKHEIDMKGSLNHQLFDSFFAHLLGVGKLWWVKTETAFEVVEKEPEKYTYDRVAVTHLLQKLQDIGFLKNFTTESLSSFEQFYTIANQLKRFHENNKEEITQLVIAGGHIGYYGIESISKYRNALTIDSSPLELPDIIADINNKELLEELVIKYEGKLDSIIETSCCGFVFDLEAGSLLLRLLRPGGRLIAKLPTGYECIDTALAETYIAKYGLKPIFSDNYYQPNIVALEKK